MTKLNSQATSKKLNDNGKEKKMNDSKIVNLMIETLGYDLGSDIGAKLLEECEDAQDREKVTRFCRWYKREDPPADVIDVILRSLFRDNEPILNELDYISRLIDHKLEGGEPCYYNYYYDQKDMVETYISPSAYVDGDLYGIVLKDLFEILEMEDPSESDEDADPFEYIPEMYKKGLIPLDIVEELIGYTGTIYKTGDDMDAERVVIWNSDGIFPSPADDDVRWIFR